MKTLHVFSIIAWVSLPTVMFGGYSLLGLLNRGALSEFQLTFFRAGHAHAGVLILMALLYIQYMERTSLSPTVKIAAAVVLVIGVLAQSGGFFLHMAIGQPGAASAGTLVTTIGAVLLAAAVAVLVYGLIVRR